MKKLSLLFILSFVCIISFSQSTYYVSQTGDDANDGSEFSPWQSLIYAVEQAADNDIIMVSGTITESNIIIAKNLTIKGTDLSTSIVQGQTTDPHLEDPRAPLVNNSVFRLNKAGFTIRLENLTIRYGNTSGQGGAIYSNVESDLTLKSCNILNNYSTGQGGGISAKGNLVIEDCTIANNVGGSHGGGIYQNFNETSVTVSNSLIYNNTSVTQQGAGMKIGAANLTLNNNTIAYNICEAVNKVEGVSYTYAGNLVLTNNIFFNNTKANDDKSGGEDFGGSTPASVISRNNIFSYVNNAAFYDDNEAVTTASGNLVNKDEVDAAKMKFGVMFQTASGHYTLPIFSGSIAEDAGDPTSATATDMLGTARTTPDIGVFEIGGSTNIPPGFVSDANLNYPENLPFLTINAADEGAISYAIIGGADQDLFDINAATGALSFLSTPTVDNPIDADGNGVYEVSIQIQDQPGLTTSKDFFITVTAAELNVLMIVVDDLNDYIGVLGGHPQTKTPNIDALANGGVLFTNAHSNSPLCNPSRSSFLSGLLPSTSGFIQQSANWRMNEIIDNSKTISEYMRDNGYATYKTGKVPHSTSQEARRWDNILDKSHDYGPTATDGNNKMVPHPSSILALADVAGALDGTYGSLANVPNVAATYTTPGHKGWWSKETGDFKYNSDEDRDKMPDERNAEWIAQHITDLSNAGSTDRFLMAAGIIRPHSPFIAPQKYFDMFPLDEIEIPEILLNDLNDIENDPNGRGGSIYQALDHSHTDKVEGLKRYLQSYLACVAFADDQIGKMMTALNNSIYKDNTVVLLFSDHGYNVGEKLYAWKNNLWDNSTRVPLIIKSPMHKHSAGSRVDHPVSLVDVYPTIKDLCSLTGDTKKSELGRDLDGHSLKPFLQDPENGTWDGDNVVLTTVGEWFFSDMKRQSYSVRSKRFRYNSNYNIKDELYDYQNDPNEWTNLIDNPAYAGVLAAMKERLANLSDAGLIMKDELEDFSKMSDYSTNLTAVNITNGNVGDNDPSQLQRNAAGNASVTYAIQDVKSVAVEMWNTVVNRAGEDVGTIKVYAAGADMQFAEITTNLKEANYSWDRNLLTYRTTSEIPANTEYIKVELDGDGVDPTKALIGNVSFYGAAAALQPLAVDDMVISVDPSTFEVDQDMIRSNDPFVPFLTDNFEDLSQPVQTGCWYTTKPEGHALAYNSMGNHAVRCGTETATLTYPVEDLTHFRFEFWTVEAKTDEENGTLRVLVAGEDEQFSEMPWKKVAIQSNYTILNAIVPDGNIAPGVKYVQIELSGGENAWNAQLGAVHFYKGVVGEYEGLFSGGNGTEGAPYLISTPEDLLELASNPDDIWPTYAHYKLTNDIDMSGISTFTTIGRNGAGLSKFNATFDGNNYAIKNLVVNQNEGHGTNDGLALFGSGDIRVSNLGLVNPTIDGTGLQKVGGIIGFMTNGEVANCFVLGGTISANNQVGGIVGSITNANASLSNCYCSATVTGENIVTGGIIGQLQTNDANSGPYTNLFFDGTVNKESIARMSGDPIPAFTNTYFNANSGWIFNNANATDLSTAERADQNSYAGFDFEDTWMMYNGRAVLKSFGVWSQSAATTEWTTAENWVYQAAPLASDNVTLSGDDFTVSGIATCADLTIESDATLDIATTGVLTVSGQLTNNAGKEALTLTYAPSAKSMLNFEGTTEATIKHSFNGVGAGTTAWQPFATGLVTNIQTADGTAELVGASASNNIFIKYLDETRSPIDPYLNAPSSLSGTEGYLVYSEQGHELNVNGTLSGNAQTYSNLSKTGNGFHMLANTMSTKLDASELIIPASTFEQAVWVYDGVSDYQTMDILEMNTHLIQPGYSFVVNASAGAPAADVIIPLTAKTTATAKKGNEVDQGIILTAEDGVHSDQAKIRLLENALESKDNYDLSKMFSMSADKLALYTEAGGKAVQTNSVPYEFSGIVPVKVRLGETGTATLTIDRSTSQYTEEVYLWKNGVPNLIDGLYSVTLNGNPQQELTLELEFGKKALNSDKTPVDGWIKSIGNKKLSISTSHDANNTLEVYTMSGKLIHQQQLSGTQNEIELNVVSGVYIAKLNGKQQIITKVLIQ